MSDLFTPRAGGILSADIAVPEHERVVQFYTDVLTTGAAPLWRDDLMNSRGMPIIGLGARTPEYEQLPLQWMPHIQVRDVVASADRAKELGGQVLMQSSGAGGPGQWAALLDPRGNAFGVIPVVTPDQMPQPDDAGGAPGPTGHIAQISLRTSDARGLEEFYREVIGWTAQPAATGDSAGGSSNFDMIGENGDTEARIADPESATDEVAPVWLLHIPVGDLGESLRRAESSGGKVVSKNSASDRTPDAAVIQDPVGAQIMLVAAPAEGAR